MKTFRQTWRKPDSKKSTEEISVQVENLSPLDREMSNLIKMKEATRLLKASAPTVRKYARLGYYKEYRFGAKLVFYNKEEILNFILNKTPQQENL